MRLKHKSFCDDKALVVQDTRWRVNSTFINCGDQLVVIDTMGDPETSMKALKLANSFFSISDIACVINTHHHYDHVLGNQVYSKYPILAHKAVPELMESYAEKLSKSIEGKRAFFNFVLTKPNQSVSSKTKLTVGKLEIELIVPGPCHTDNDLLVMFPSLKLIVCGDIHVPDTIYPLNLNSRGDIENWISTLSWLETENSQFTLIPGHFFDADQKTVQMQRNYLKTLINQKDTLDAKGRDFKSFSRMRNFDRYHQHNVKQAVEFCRRRAAKDS
jgi:glyoxylase-like metal-dependent hydrolase (beta-lactamase superfamily II)